MVFNRIKEEREKRNLSQQDIANMLCINRRTYSSYETGIRGLPVETLIQLADIFETSTDYLLGLTEHQEPYESERYSTKKKPEKTTKNVPNITVPHDSNEAHNDIFDLELSVRTTKLLLSAEINTIDRLKKSTYKKLASINGMSPASLNEIMEALTLPTPKNKD